MTSTTTRKLPPTITGHHWQTAFVARLEAHYREWQSLTQVEGNDPRVDDEREMKIEKHRTSMLTLVQLARDVGAPVPNEERFVALVGPR